MVDRREPLSQSGEVKEVLRAAGIRSEETLDELAERIKHIYVDREPEDLVQQREVAWHCGVPVWL